MFNLRIATNTSSAFKQGQGKPEIARILRELADRIEAIDGAIGQGNVRDGNGYLVGSFDCEE